MEKERYLKNLKKIEILSKNKNNSEKLKVTVGKNLVKSIKDLGCNPEKALYHPNKVMPYIAVENSLNKRKGIKKIGQGVWGSVYVGCLDKECTKKVAIKIQKEESILHEYKMGRRLSPLGGTVKSFYHEKCKDVSVMYTEYANNGNLKEYMKNNSKKLLPIHYRSIVTQVLYTLYKIHNKYPTFRHNDLHTENVLVNTTLKPPKAKMYKIGNTSLKIHDIGLQTLISDFGLSTLKGFKCPPIDNDITFYKSKYGIFRDSHPMYDVHFFLNDVYASTNNIPNAVEIRQFIERILKPEYIGKESSKVLEWRLRSSPLGHPNLPTFKQIFNDRFFSPYKKSMVPIDISTIIKRRSPVKPVNIIVKHGGKTLEQIKKELAAKNNPNKKITKRPGLRRVVPIVNIKPKVKVTQTNKGYIRLGTRKCESYKKSELQKMARELGVQTQGKTIKKICDDIKIKYV